MNHVSLAVSDLDAALEFYGRAFGFEPLFVEELAGEIAGMTGVAGMRCRLAQLKRPEHEVTLELIEFDSPGADERHPPTAVGHGHVAFSVDDLDDRIETVTRLGARPLGEAVAFPEGRAIYMREPGGSVFELTEIDPTQVS